MRNKQSSRSGAMPTLLASFLLWSAHFLSAQTINVPFGKNRVQYHHQQQEWQYYETPHFTTYWYGDARNIAITALQTAEADYNDVQRLLEYQLNDRVDLLVFSDLTDLKQSNIGVDELFAIKSGETKTDGNKIFVYYTGDHNQLRESIREGIADVLVNAMLLGGNLQEIVQNSVLLNLPGWYTSGLKAYCGADWNVATDEQLRNVIVSGKFTRFDQLARQHPVLAGHAFWQYVAEHFGAGAISNLMYLTRINRGLDAGFRYIMGTGYDRTTALIMEHYQQRYKADLSETAYPVAPIIKMTGKRKHPVFRPRISPDGKYVVWVKNDIGRWKVIVRDLKTKKQQVVLKGGVRNALQSTDYAYPLPAWSPDGATLGILFEQRDVPKLAKIDWPSGKKEIKPISPEFQRVHSMDFINSVDLAFAATVRGYTDIYIYHSITRQTERLTQDYWDDHDVAFVRLGSQRYLAFSSNRTGDTLSQQRIDTILPTGTRDVFLYHLDTRSNELIRLSSTPLFNEYAPIATDSAHLAWISDENGIQNRISGYLEDYIAYYQVSFYLKNGSEVKALDTQLSGEWAIEKALLQLPHRDTVYKNLDSLQIDSVRSVPVFRKRAVSWLQTAYPSALLDHSVAGRGTPGKMLEHFKKGKEHVIYISPVSAPEPPARSLPHTLYRQQTLRAAGMEAPAQPTLRNTSTRPEEDSIPPGWAFYIPEHLRQPTAMVVPADITTEPSSSPDDTAWNIRQLNKRKKYISEPKTPITRFNPSKIIAYRLKFRTDFISTDMNNDFLFEGLSSYAGSPNGFKTPPPGVLLKANFKELLENYVIEAGMRLPTTFNGAEYYLWLDKRKKRLDYRYALYRKTTVSTLEGGQPGLSPYPFQVRNNTLLGQYEVKYPLDPFFSLRGLATLRQDKTMTLTSDQATLETPDYNEQRLALRIGAVYDNTVEKDINIRYGSRARLYVEAVKRFEMKVQPDFSLKFNSGFMTVLNLDARHYQRLDRHSIIALRVAGATTFGSERILYYLGGVDNSILPKFNQGVPVAATENFAYQTLAAHLRGFQQNIRNGGSFALVNTELRIPVFKYLMHKPVLGNFWRNFQVIGFFDAGTAWTGSSPYSADNPINIEYLQNPPTVQVKVQYFRDPLVAGYGAGVRMQLFGLYLRGDYAWGIETKRIQKPVFHIALGADF